MCRYIYIYIYIYIYMYCVCLFVIFVVCLFVCLSACFRCLRLHQGATPAGTMKRPLGGAGSGVNRMCNLHACCFQMSSCTCSSVGKVRLSDVGGPRLDSQTGRVRGKSIPSPWRDKHPASKGPRPPEHHVGQLLSDQKDSSESQKKQPGSSQSLNGS